MRKIKTTSISYDKLFKLKGLDRRYWFRTDPDDYHYTFIDPLPSRSLVLLRSSNSLNVESYTISTMVTPIIIPMIGSVTIFGIVFP